MESAQDVADRAAKDGRVVEEAAEEEEEEVERDREPDEQGPGRAVETHFTGTCESVLRSSQTRSRPVTSAYRSTPLAPKLVNRSSMFAEIT